jgi:hypothetical protein
MRRGIRMIKITVPEDVHERVAILKARMRKRTLYEAIDKAVRAALEEIEATDRREKEPAR